jgi:hypothetical protein
MAGSCERGNGPYVFKMAESAFINFVTPFPDSRCGSCGHFLNNNYLYLPFKVRF